MSGVILVLHLLICAALIVVVLLQRSEGGALGISGSQAGMSGMFSGRGQTGVLTRVTALLAMGFFATSITLTILAELGREAPTLVPGEPGLEGGVEGPLLPLDVPALPGDGRPTGPVQTPVAPPAAPAGESAPPAPAEPPQGGADQRPAVPAPQ